MRAPNNKKQLFKYVLPIILVFVTGIITAQKPYFKRIYINRENSNLKFTVILNGHDHFLWFGSTDGIYKYDGSDPFLLSVTLPDFDNTVSALYQDNGDTLWAGYKSGKITYVINNEIHLFQPKEGLPIKPITGLSKDDRGNLWIATAGEGAYYYANGRLTNINTDDGLNDNYTYVVTPDKNGNVWVGTDEGIAICKAGIKNKIVQVFHKHDGLPDQIVRAITHDSQGDIWIGTQEKGICKFIPEQNRFFVPPDLVNWSYGQVNNINFDRNEIWIGTEEKGLVHYDPKLSSKLNFIREFNTLRFPKISDATLDREGNLWMIANANIYQSSAGSFLLLDQLSDLNLKMIHALMFDRKGKLWLTPDQGLVSFSFSDTTNNQLRKYTITPEKELIDIVSLYEDECDYVWIGTMGAGIFRLNPANGKIQQINGDKRLLNGSIMAIAGKDDQLWLATLGGAFQLKLPADCNTDHIVPEYTKLENENLIGNFYLYDVFVDSRGRTWFGTDGKGITCIDHGEYFNYNEHSGLKSNVIYSITEDKYGNIWFSTLNSGIYKFDGTNFKNYNQSDGLRYNSISSIMADRKGHLVIVHRHGFDVFDIENESFIYYGSEVGISDINSDLNAIDCDKNGRIWIGTEDQLISFNDNGNTYTKKPLSVISKASLFTNEINKEANKRLSYNQNYLSFDFNGLWYSNPDRVKYQYMMEGYNKEWIPTRDRRIIFPNLPPGKYKFKVRTSLNKNFKQFTEASYAFVIHPPFWKENWFLFLMVIIFSGLVYLIIRVRIEQIRRIESLKNEKIEFQYETLKSQVNPHFLFNSFNTLITVIEEDKNKAIEYVETLSAFFRNIVSYKDHDLIFLSDELELASNYFFLQKKRYGDYLTMKIEVTEDAKQKEIPPMVLQILIENAIKHNAVSHESKLHICIGISGNKLEVKNNINPKRTIESSTKSGLQNIINRFKLLTSEEIEIINNNNYFIVKIPLL